MPPQRPSILLIQYLHFLLQATPRAISLLLLMLLLMLLLQCPTWTPP